VLPVLKASQRLRFSLELAEQRMPNAMGPTCYSDAVSTESSAVSSVRRGSLAST
jgi:hypothetical protein